MPSFNLQFLMGGPRFVIIESRIANLPVISNSCKSGPVEIIKHEEMGICFRITQWMIFKQLKNFENEDQKSLIKKLLIWKSFQEISIFKFYKIS